jgi:hypothetical protein
MIFTKNINQTYVPQVLTGRYHQDRHPDACLAKEDLLTRFLLNDPGSSQVNATSLTNMFDAGNLQTLMGWSEILANQ